MWKMKAPIKLSHGCTLKPGYGNYFVCNSKDELIGAISAGYFHTRRDVLAKARCIVSNFKEDNPNDNPNG